VYSVGCEEREKMKKLHLAPYCLVLTLGNCALPPIIGQITGMMRETFSHGVGGEKALPGVTKLALTIPLWFYIFPATSILACAGLLIRKVPVSFLTHWLLCICILECCTLFFFALGMSLPFYSLMW
jgi:hypothetical protein